MAFSFFQLQTSACIFTEVICSLLPTLAWAEIGNGTLSGLFQWAATLGICQEIGEEKMAINYSYAPCEMALTSVSCYMKVIIVNPIKMVIF